MIQGAAYDQVMKFIDEDPNFDVKNEEQVAHNFSSRYNTGSKPEDKGYNIYDLTGNLVEWTTEAEESYRRIYRGGKYYTPINAVIMNSASYRGGLAPTNVVGYINGSRSALYIK